MPFAIRLKKRYRARLLIIGHGTYANFPFIRRLTGYRKRLLARSIGCFVVPSRLTRARVAEWWAQEVTVVPWVVDSTFLHPADVTEKRSFAFVGSQKARKGIDCLLNTFARLAADHPHGRLHMLGSIDPAFRKKVIKARLEEQVLLRIISCCLSR